ncbi:MAG TPA: hypothetical protein PKY87_16435, partial [Terricaulis sp.]|nr:hypothetical protein [Terricaulis sp.]
VTSTQYIVLDSLYASDLPSGKDMALVGVALDHLGQPAQGRGAHLALDIAQRHHPLVLAGKALPSSAMQTETVQPARTPAVQEGAQSNSRNGY